MEQHAQNCEEKTYFPPLKGKASFKEDRVSQHAWYEYSLCSKVPHTIVFILKYLLCSCTHGQALKDRHWLWESEWKPQNVKTRSRNRFYFKDRSKNQTYDDNNRRESLSITLLQKKESILKSNKISMHGTKISTDYVQIWKIVS